MDGICGGNRGESPVGDIIKDAICDDGGKHTKAVIGRVFKDVLDGVDKAAGDLKHGNPIGAVKDVAHGVANGVQAAVTGRTDIPTERSQDDFNPSDNGKGFEWIRL